MLRLFLVWAGFWMFNPSAFCQIPSWYYDQAAYLTGEPLRVALHHIIDDHVEFPYTSSGTDVWDILKRTDQDTIDTTKVVLLYTGWTLNADLEYDNGNGWSREHVWANSRGDFGTANGPGTDVHALRPADITVNSARGNRWFAECSEQYIDADGPTGSFMSSSSWVWKPRNEVKGDVARMIFYMDTRYDGGSGELDLQVIDYIPSDDNTNLPIHAKLSDLYQWHLEDPVSDWERRRNDIIYYDYQGNRNPYIDHPEFVEMIWGPLAKVDSLTLIPKPKLLKIVDLMGREVEYTPNVLLLYLYDDGSVEKKVVYRPT